MQIIILFVCMHQTIVVFCEAQYKTEHQHNHTNNFNYSATDQKGNSLLFFKVIFFGREREREFGGN